MQQNNTTRAIGEAITDHRVHDHVRIGTRGPDHSQITSQITSTTAQALNGTPVSRLISDSVA